MMHQAPAMPTLGRACLSRSQVRNTSCSCAGHKCGNVSATDTSEKVLQEKRAGTHTGACWLWPVRISCSAIYAQGMGKYK